MRATGAPAACARSITGAIATTLLTSSSRVTEAHGVAHVAHGFLGELARLLTAVGDDRPHQRWIVEVLLRALVERQLLGDDGVDHRLLAFEAADAGGGAAFLHPVARRLVGIHLVQRPDRTIRRVAGIG